MAMISFRPRVAESLLWSLAATYTLAFRQLSLPCLASLPAAGLFGANLVLTSDTARRAPWAQGYAEAEG
jgi:hypothetical protein